MATRTLTRRDALKLGSSVLVTGVAGSAAAQELAKNYSRSALQERTEEILNFATSQKFMDELDAVLSTPKPNQLKEAARRFDPKRLSQLGLAAPPKTRISSRIFDETIAKSHVLGDTLQATTTLNISTVGRRPTKLDIDELVDRKKLLQRARETAAGVCVCVGGGACVGIGGNS